MTISNTVRFFHRTRLLFTPQCVAHACAVVGWPTRFVAHPACEAEDADSPALGLAKQQLTDAHAELAVEPS